MINVCIFEDEPAAQRRLIRMIKEIRPDWVVSEIRDSVESAISLLKIRSFDLILSDIQLSDGLCFEIFKKLRPNIPIIFITAFDEYAIKAFDFNSVHYLVKPITHEALHFALLKFEKNQIDSNNSVIDTFSGDLHTFSSKILSKVGTKTILIDPQNIAFIYASNRITKCVLFENREHYLDQSLEKLISFLPQRIFFRINRQYIVNINAIKKFQKHSSNRLLLSINSDTAHELIVSKEKVPSFRQWIKKE